jgi:putative membrane protein
MTAMTPWFLLVCGLAVIWPSIRTSGKRFLLWGAAVYVVTFFLEALGVATGLVFGEYRYGPTLGLAAFGVPLVIAFNWAVVVFGAVSMAGRRKRSDFMVAVMTGVVATMFDWIMEPVAIQLDYWTWAGGYIPLQNYLAWFLIATASAFAYRKLVMPYGRRTDGDLADGDLADGAGSLAGFYVLVQAGFFAALRLGWTLGL